MEIHLNWTNFKEQVTSRQIPIQCVTTQQYYYLIAADGFFVVSCNIDIKTDKSADQIDFETNYLSATNKSPRLVKPFADAQGFRARLTGVHWTAPAGQSTNLDYCLTEERWISGARLMLSHHTDADTLKFQIVDVNGVLGMGSNLVLDEFATDWNVVSDQQDQGVYEVPYLARIYQWLYIRIVYKSEGVEDVSVRINLFLHKKTT